jgi:hypothetical protein
MIVKTSINREIEITESYMVVKDNKLYNNNTKTYEGVDGDRVSFETTLESGSKMVTTGTVDGYTHDGVIKIKGVNEPYKIDGNFTVEHLVKIVETLDKKPIFAEISYID